jgi:Tfp pilus assembly protein PilF
VALAAFFSCAHAPYEARPKPTPLEQAHHYVQNGEPQRALPLLAELEKASPDSLEIARLKAEAYVRAGRAAELTAELESHPPSRAATHYLLALIYAAGAAQPEHGAAAARAQLEAAIALRPSEAELHYRLGLVLLSLKRPEQAIGPLRRAIELDGKRTAPFLSLAKALHQVGRRDEALTPLAEWTRRGPPEAELAVAKSVMDEIAPPFDGMPTSAQPICLKAAALLEEDDPVSAIALLEQLAREHPQAAIVHALLALCHRRLDEAGRAIDELREAIALAPSDGRSHQYLGEVYLERRQLAQAKSEFARAIELNPLLEHAHLALAQLAMEESDLPGARRHLTIAVSLDPHNPAVAQQLGVLNLRALRHAASAEEREQSRAEAVR